MGRLGNISGKEAAKAFQRAGWTPSPSYGDELDGLAAAGAVRLGNNRLPSEFWDLPQPEDPDDAVRRAVLEERAGGW